ncbi:MAG: hypothetical protein A2046_07390 [Bacteroidetes bacterium GWA2_30_7]|nr:MAG: hypothetical protein A2046_07390 [Bacteroidetes bacterium GWA2_30_7]
MINKEIIEAWLNEIFTVPKFFLVEVNVSKSKIDIFFDSFEGVIIENCVKINRQFVEKFPEANEIFEVNVSSPGITQPFKVFNQYKKNISRNVEVLLKDGKKLTGLLTSVEPEYIDLEIEKKETIEGSKKKQIVKELLRIEFNKIKTTKLIISFK